MSIFPVISFEFFSIEMSLTYSHSHGIACECDVVRLEVKQNVVYVKQINCYALGYILLSILLIFVASQFTS